MDLGISSLSNKAITNLHYDSLKMKELLKVKVKT